MSTVKRYMPPSHVQRVAKRTNDIMRNPAKIAVVEDFLVNSAPNRAMRRAGVKYRSRK